jgi:hypothetical protein
MGVSDPYERIPWRGVILNRRTAAMMEVAQAKFGRPFDAIPQGSYGGTPQSAGTHDGGGAVDIFDRDLDRVQHVMREVGFADWHRTFLPGPNGWDPHCHGIALADKEMSDAARAQIRDYRNYLNGLANHAADNTWHPFPKGADPGPVFNYANWLKEQDMQLDDRLYPAVDGNHTTIGEALRRADHIDEFRKVVDARFVHTNAHLGEVEAKTKSNGADIAALREHVDNRLDNVKADLKAILDAVTAT